MLFIFIVCAKAAFWSSLALGETFASDKLTDSLRAELVDPRLLEEPMQPIDPLENLKHLWAMGARGSFFRVSGSDEDRENGYYLAINNWSSVHLRRGAMASFFNDAELLNYIKTLHNLGTEFIVQNRVSLGGFAVPINSRFHEVIRPIVPKLARQPYISINGYTDRYFVVHELVHHSDHVSGLAEEIWYDIYYEVLEFNLDIKDRETIYSYIIEARAYLAEISAAHNTMAPFHWAAYSLPAGEQIVIYPVLGANFRAELIHFAIGHFNQTYFADFERLPSHVKLRVDHLLTKYIPNRMEQFGFSNEMRLERIKCPALLTQQ